MALQWENAKYQEIKHNYGHSKAAKCLKNGYKVANLRGAAQLARRPEGRREPVLSIVLQQEFSFSTQIAQQG